MAPYSRSAGRKSELSMSLLKSVIHRVPDHGYALRSGRKIVLSMSCWRSFIGSQMMAPHSRTEECVVDVLLEVIHRVNVLSMSSLRSFIGSRITAPYSKSAGTEECVVDVLLGVIHGVPDNGSTPQKRTEERWAGISFAGCGAAPEAWTYMHTTRRSIA